jgi:Flp pilus assembly protein TadG
MAKETQGVRNRERGTATVEFAIALPLLLFLMLATAELGRLISHYNTLTKSIRDAARYAASKAGGGSTGLVNITGQLQTEVGNLVATGTVNGSGSPLLPGLSASNVTLSDAGNLYVRVSVAYTYQPMLGGTLPSFGLGSSVSLALPLNAGVLMRIL